MEHKVESVMTAKVVTAMPSTPFRELVDLLARNRISALPVVDQDAKLVGIVSEADLLVKEGYPHGGDDAGALEALRHRRRFGKAAGCCASEVMTRRVVTLSGRAERRSQVEDLVRKVQAVDGVVTVDARIESRIDDVTPMGVWPIV